MSKVIDKIIRQAKAPKNKNVLWDNGINLHINRNGVWESIGSNNTQGTISITYKNLKELRDNKSLIPGTYYRIIDYTTETAQENTISAGHFFDVVVLALTNAELSDEAYALHSERDVDGYFSNCDLTAWQIWYSLDNDTKRFGWADAENGKGVIYRMIDEFNNDLSYDFKNIIYIDKVGFKYTQWGQEFQFARDFNFDKVIDGTQYYGYISKTVPPAWSDGKCWLIDAIVNADSQMYKEDGSTISYGGVISDIVTIDNEYYTFRKGNEDDSLYGITKDNVVKTYLRNGTQLLNKNIFGAGCYSNELGHDSFNNTFGDNCYENTLLGGFIEQRGQIRYCAKNFLGNECYRNVFGYASFNNTFGSNCYDNTFGSNCYDNTFGSNCFDNSFSNECSRNSLGEGCNVNTFGDMFCNNSLGKLCAANSFGNNCYDTSFGNNCNYNSFGNQCSNTRFGSKCNSNSFGNDCESNILTNGCHYNSFGNYCHHNTFGDNCKYNSLDTGCYGNSLKNSGCNNSFGNDCHNNSFNENCSSNSFGNSCTYNSFGNSCYSNSFGNNCDHNSLGNDCGSNSFGNACSSNSFAFDSDTAGDYFYCNSLEDGVEHVTLQNDSTASYANRVQYYKIANGMSGTSNSPLVVEVERNKSVETYIGMNSEGEIKKFCLVDFLNS